MRFSTFYSKNVHTCPFFLYYVYQNNALLSSDSVYFIMLWRIKQYCLLHLWILLKYGNIKSFQCFLQIQCLEFSLIWFFVCSKINASRHRLSLQLRCYYMLSYEPLLITNLMYYRPFSLNFYVLFLSLIHRFHYIPFFITESSSVLFWFYVNTICLRRLLYINN